MTTVRTDVNCEQIPSAVSSESQDNIVFSWGQNDIGPYQDTGEDFEEPLKYNTAAFVEFGAVVTSAL